MDPFSFLFFFCTSLQETNANENVKKQKTTPPKKNSKGIKKKKESRKGEKKPITTTEWILSQVLQILAKRFARVASALEIRGSFRFMWKKGGKKRKKKKRRKGDQTPKIALKGEEG